MTRPRTTARMILGAGALAALVGCGRTAPPADPRAAQETLVRALDGWKKGDPLEAFQKAPPAVTVVDPQWRQGVRLLDYELDGPAEPHGFDAQFTVKLWLQDRAGKKFKEKAAYTVSTSPARVIVRSEGPG
jgi:hypothetical protein